MILQPDDIAIDYSFARPLPSAIVAAGVKLVVRYISPRRDHPKNITAAERDALLDAGLSLLLVWENAQTDPLQGATLGAKHGAMAESFAHDLGNPDDIPVIAAVDTNSVEIVGGKVVSRIPAFLDYLGAFDATCGFPPGAYGNDQVVTAAHDAGVSVLGWQTRAWSGGRRSPHADVLQQIGFVHPQVAALGSVDDNTVLRSFTAWSTSMAPPAPPRPPASVEDDMNPNRFVRDDRENGWQIWEVGVDSQGQWSQTTTQRGVDWTLYNAPALDTVPLASLQAHQRPPASDAGLPGLVPHRHDLPATTLDVAP